MSKLQFLLSPQNSVDLLTRLVGWDDEGLGGNNEDSEEKSGAEHGQICLFGNCDVWDALLTYVFVVDVQLPLPIFEYQLPGFLRFHRLHDIHVTLESRVLE